MSKEQMSRQRTPFTDIERQRLRIQHQNIVSSTPKNLASWFEHEFGRKITVSSVHDILSDKYAYLDTTEATNTTRRQRGPEWQELEDALFQWWQEEQPREVTGVELKKQAKELWRDMPAYQGKNMPSFSDGWLTKWRTRHSLAQPRRTAVVASLNSYQNPRQVHMADDAIPSPFKRLKSASLFRHEYGQRDLPSCSTSDAHRVLDPLRTPTPTHIQHSCTQEKIFQPGNSTIGSSFNRFGHNEEALNTSTSSHITAGHRTKRRRLQGQCIPVHPCAVAIRSACSSISPNVGAMASRQAQQDFESADLKLWRNIAKLFSSYSGQRTNDETISAKLFLEVLKPIFTDTEHKLKRQVPETLYGSVRSEAFLTRYLATWQNNEETTASNSQKAISLLGKAEMFRLPRLIRETQVDYYEDWFLESLCFEKLREESPEISGEDGGLSVILVKDAKDSSSAFRCRGLKRQTTFSSTASNGGQVHVWAQKYTNSGDSSQREAIESFFAKVAITPPTHMPSIPYTVFSLASRVTKRSSTLLTPTITFQIMRPASDEIFKIAETGTSMELQLAIRNGVAPLAVCDPEGRSLVNYALRGTNVSTLRFLLTGIDDVNAFEPDRWGTVGPLIGLLNNYLNVLDSEDKRRKRLKCTEIMLDFGADPSLPTSLDLAFTSVFNDMVTYGSLLTTKVMLDKGLPFLGAKETLFNIGLENVLFSNMGPENVLFSIWRYCHGLGDWHHYSEKIYLLLDRGFDARVVNKSNQNLLHQMLRYLAFKILHPISFECVKDILISIISAGADVYARDIYGISVSETACRNGLEEIWMEALAKCGFDPASIVCIKEKYLRRQNPAFGIFSTAVYCVRPTKLSLKEHGQQRKPALYIDVEEYWYTLSIDEYIKESREWESFQNWIDEESREDYCEDEDIYSTEHGAEWWL